MACTATCYQIEYRAETKIVTKATPNPDNKATNTAKNRADAEKLAKDQLDAEMAKKKEDVNNCAILSETGCNCPPWPATWDGGWKADAKDLSSIQTVTTPDHTVWQVVIIYERQNRSRSAKCK